jgi:hypothetical protein
MSYHLSLDQSEQRFVHDLKGYKVQFFVELLKCPRIVRQLGYDLLLYSAYQLVVLIVLIDRYSAGGNKGCNDNHKGDVSPAVLEEKDRHKAAERDRKAGD